MAREEIVSNASEQLILVDDHDREIGFKGKADCHTGVGVLHRAFSIFSGLPERLRKRTASFPPSSFTSSQYGRPGFSPVVVRFHLPSTSFWSAAIDAVSRTTNTAVRQSRTRMGHS